MCELLIRIKDRKSIDPDKDIKLTKRGDVIAVVPDGWNWGERELDNPEWRILKLPNVTEDKAALLVQAEQPVDESTPNRILRIRAYKFAVDASDLPANLLNYLKDGTRTQASFTLNATAAQIKNYIIQKVRLTDPTVL